MPPSGCAVGHGSRLRDKPLLASIRVCGIRFLLCSDRMTSAMDTATMRSDLVGSVIDQRFTLLEWLGGSGGSGVFLTELDEYPSRKAAIKLIPADAENAKALIAGWAAASSLSHPHLLRLLRTGRCQIGDAELLYVVTEYAEEVLSEILPEQPLTPQMAREMLDPLLDALAYLHGKGFVHGRVKPSNIMVVDDRLKLSCDNLHAAGRLGRRSPASSVYDAPESGSRPITPAADVWSLGITVVEALTQHPPVWDRADNSDPVVPESIPQPFLEIAQRCLRRDPLLRCTLSDVKTRLGSDLSQSGRAGQTGKTQPGRLRMAMLAAAGLVVISGIAWMLVRSHKAPASLLTPSLATPSLPTVVKPSVPAIAAVQPPSPAPAAMAQTSKGGLVKGEVAERVMPEVPEKARVTIQGKIDVSVRAAVGPGGDVSDASFQSPGPSKYFANLALQAARNWKFKPAQADGQAVSSVWLLRFQFRQTGTEVVPVEVSP